MSPPLTTSLPAHNDFRVGELRLGRAFQTFWPAAAIFALAVVPQILWRTSSDVSWIITLCEKILSGQKPYVDFIETNPPGAIYLYLPDVIVAHVFGYSPEFSIALDGFLAIAVCLFLSARILRRTGLNESLGPIGLAFAVMVLTLLPNGTFDQREHLAVVFGLPFFAALVARASSADVGVGLRVTAGFFGAVMMSIKPHFALMVAPTLPYLYWRLGARKTFASIELYAAAYFLLLYAALIAIFFPTYLDRIVPIAAAIYAPTRAPLFALAFNLGAMCWATLGVVVLVFGRGRLKEPLIAIPALASVGAMAGFLIQGKGWPYHLYPALALIALATAPVVLRAFTIPRKTDGVATIAAVAAALAAGFLFCSRTGEAASEPIEKIVASLAPHPKILVIGSDIALGHPLTRQVSGEWVGTPNSLWITAMAQYLMRQGPVDAATRERYETYMRFERETLVSDIKNRTPDAILIANDKWKAWALAHADVAAALADYAPVAGDGEVAVYGLKPALRPTQ